MNASSSSRPEYDVVKFSIIVIDIFIVFSVDGTMSVLHGRFDAFAGRLFPVSERRSSQPHIHRKNNIEITSNGCFRGFKRFDGELFVALPFSITGHCQR